MKHILNKTQAMKITKQPVIPLKADKKNPILAGWQKTSITELTCFSKRKRGSNWGVRCDNIVVVDVDAKPENAATAIRDMEAFKSRILELDTYIVSTRSGNPHAYFAIDERMKDWRKRVGLWGFVDICIGAQSQVVAAGSVVEGKTYKEVKRDDINRMPDWLVDEINIEMLRGQKEIRERVVKEHHSQLSH